MTADAPSESGSRPDPAIDITVPHSPRIWNYWLGGKDNYAVDREAGDQFVEIYPDIVPIARHSRAFLSRAVTHLAGEAGIRQFLDIGTGLPTLDNTHQVAQRAAADAHIVYVDNDPVVLAHARALLTSSPEGATHYIDADLRDPERIFEGAGKLLDFEQPVALILLNILGHVEDTEEAVSIVTRLMNALPSGSYLVTADGTNVVTGKAFEDAIAIWNEVGRPTYHLRTPEQIARFHSGLELLDPGIVSCSRWRPQENPFGEPAQVDEFCAVGRKP
ncbi:SAM-dependent methyltransferase [Streptomyces sp. NBC_01465]|uniref:SAM-dependent methyltransferase n=1 Tax=Streptomyces sp. NBC_01465 TaxID=2903878 RepID=UPI002E332071|nr:SAM-dependent methyltransferase [Streptomyces sp. NBC_01465]